MRRAIQHSIHEAKFAAVRAGKPTINVKGTTVQVINDGEAIKLSYYGSIIAKWIPSNDTKVIRKVPQYDSLTSLNYIRAFFDDDDIKKVKGVVKIPTNYVVEEV